MTGLLRARRKALAQHTVSADGQRQLQAIEREDAIELFGVNPAQVLDVERTRVSVRAVKVLRPDLLQGLGVLHCEREQRDSRVTHETICRTLPPNSARVAI